MILASNGLDAAGGLDLAWLGESSRRLGLSRAVHYHVGMAGCAGFHWAARLAASLVAADQCDSVLIVTFDKGEGALQRLYGEDTDFPYLTGDAAAACLVGQGRGAERVAALQPVQVRGAVRPQRLAVGQQHVEAAVRAPSLVMTALPANHRDMFPWLELPLDAKTQKDAADYLRIIRSVRIADSNRLVDS